MPSSWRSDEIARVRLPSSTATSPHTASSRSCFGPDARLLDERGQEVEELGWQRDRLHPAKELSFVDVEAIRPERERGVAGIRVTSGIRPDPVRTSRRSRGNRWALILSVLAKETGQHIS